MLHVMGDVGNFVNLSKKRFKGAEAPQLNRRQRNLTGKERHSGFVGRNEINID